MPALGKQVIFEFYECQAPILDDTDAIRALMIEAAEHIGATVVTSTMHHFSPFGVSGVIVLAESHLAVHTWPEHDLVTVDVFTCGQTIDGRRAEPFLRERLQAGRVSVLQLDRGHIGEPQAQELSA